MVAGAVADSIVAAASYTPFRGEDALELLFVEAGAGLGAVFGFTADALIQGNKLLYRR